MLRRLSTKVFAYRSFSVWSDGPFRFGGHPDQTELLTGRAVFKTAYAVIPRDVMRDIVTSILPFWEKSRAWILARPLSGFAETFSQYIVECEPSGGSTKPETEQGVQSVLFVLDGELSVNVQGESQTLTTGGFVYVPPDAHWSVHNDSLSSNATFTWVRKRYQYVDGIQAPSPLFSHDDKVQPTPMPGTNGAWATTRFVNPQDTRHDMHCNIVTFKPGAVIPFKETHVMEHGLLVLQGKAVYHLNDEWVEVQKGDFLWLRAFCPQACYAGGPHDFRYLLYKDVNRHAPFLF
eukprot:CAMPEP_0197314996 /NCGR_PEP_ID=MMETSP0891-20130614/36122_1 /TAXON_ID=44058 ORGANISM="Aureoumbra lagunensis, Strain CCMP1510" /NCGR_SAMPLE_ID=MMETSP0891 /ASSEMBLY_ACC=CAM_ASM_000534 /LENGTH=290 /DNA_ID=CAMNT_0042803719 /DNA_START=1 /DNA_END=873 /DNA_ORIENTATION=+